VDAANYVPCGPRLSQGDIVRAPSGVFVAAADLSNPAEPSAADGPIPFGEPAGLAMPIPRLTVGGLPVVLRAWYLPAVVVSPDCGIDKEPAQVLIAPILPLAAARLEDQDGIRSGTFLSAFDLPADPALELADGSNAPFPHSFVDLTRTVPLTPRLLGQQRMVALSDDQLDRLQESFVRFVALREIGSTGTVAAAAGKRVQQVATVESSRRRHTVVFSFDDGSIVVLYQDPRRRGDHLQTVAIQAGNFAPGQVQALAGTNLVLRFENNDRRDWHLFGKEAGIQAIRLAAAATTEVLIACPDHPEEIRLINADRRSSVLSVWVVDAL
jgi:hypothetical protein